MSKFVAKHKKEPGIIEILGDKVLVWQPQTEGSRSPVRVPLDTVTTTPPTSAVLQLKIICQSEGEPQSFQFAFIDRPVMDNCKATLQKLVQAIKTKANTNGTTAAPSKRSVVDLDSKKLLTNLTLQQAFLKENKDLFRRFQETVIEGGLDPGKFWSMRLHMLRSYALSSSQKRGAYNVLGTIKPTVGADNRINMSLTREKIKDIFEQYPLVRKAYNDNVPSRMAEGNFWERFFTSRLFRRLRGEKVAASHPIDAILDDKYLRLFEQENESMVRGVQAPGIKRSSDEQGGETDAPAHRVPQFIDVEGNEENDPQKLGNRPDITMQPGKSDVSSISLIRSMNSLSQRMLYGNTSTPLASAGNKTEDNLDDQLKFGDLESQDTRDVHAKLTLVKDNTANGNSVAAQDLGGVARLSTRSALRDSFQGPIDFQKAWSYSEEISAARDQVTDILGLRALESSATSLITRWEADTGKKLIDDVQICHATSVEFLHHFWTAFLSGDPAQATGIVKFVDALRNSLTRIDSVVSATDSEQDQQDALQSLSSLQKSLHVAISTYEKTLAEALLVKDKEDV